MTETNTVPPLGNLAVSSAQEFACDDVVLICGTCTPDAMFIVDAETRGVVASNLKFLELLDLQDGGLESGEIRMSQWVPPTERAALDAWIRAVLEGEDGVFETRLLRRDGQTVSVTVQLRHLRWKRRPYVIGFVRDVTSLEETITRLRQQVEEQKARAFEAIKSSLRLYQFNEKIKRTPQLAKSLLHLDIEENLFAEAAHILTSEEGLGYKEASFLLAENNLFRVVYSTMAGTQGRTFSMLDDHRYSRFVRNAFRQDDDSSPSALVPLQSRGQFLGLFEVTSHTKEKLFFDESSMVVEWQKDVLHDIGGILALLLDNLRLNRELKRQSTVDPLTQTYNRHYFAGRLTTEVRRARRYSRPTSLVFIDVDHFKQINDRYGHLQGDQVLRDLGQLLVNALREVDVVCRYGGDEFVLLLPETDGTMATQTAEKIRQRVSEFAFRSLDNPEVMVPVTISVGVSMLGETGTEEELLQQADAALYSAKSLGRNRVACDADAPTG